MTTTDILRSAPPCNDEFRHAIYDGAIFLLPATAASKRLSANVLALIEAELGQDGPVREAQFRISADDMFSSIASSL